MRQLAAKRNTINTDTEEGKKKLKVLNKQIEQKVNRLNQILNSINAR
jgi:hypothetical protein